MHAFRLPLGRPLPPFGDHPLDLPVLGRPLRDVQDELVAGAGLSWAGAPPDEPWLALGDHTWLTAPLLRRFLDQAPASGGQLVLDGPMAEFTAPLQGLPAATGGGLRYPVAVVPGGPCPPARLASLPPVRVDLDAHLHPVPVGHPAFAEAMVESLPVSDAVAHTLDHWSHLLRVNLLALVALAEGQRRRVDAMPWWRKLWEGLRLVLRARSLSRWRLAAAVSQVGPGGSIHPTATVEASILGEGVEVGPHAVVRASWLGDGVKVGEHAQVNLTVAGPRAQLGRGVMANLCVLFEGALLSQGFGYQVSVVGRDAFVAHGATAYDLSFGGEIQVRHRGEFVSSGSRFLGVAIGHRARVMPHVVLGYGEAVPSDAFLVGEPARVVRRIPEEVPEGPVAWRDGELVSVRRRAVEE